MEQRKFIDNNMLIRCISGLILIPLVLLTVYQGGILYNFAILLLAVLMAFEWRDLISKQTPNKFSFLWQIFSVLYIVLPCASMIWLREQPKGFTIILWMLSVIWATDSAAYFVGKAIGGWKIWPAISPNKTWSGLVGGVLAAYLVGCITVWFNDSEKPNLLIFLSVVLSIYGQIGDMVESWIKRTFGVKDSGKAIPGHGGILDRVDSLVPVAPKVAMVVFFDHWGIF